MQHPYKLLTPRCRDSSPQGGSLNCTSRGQNCPAIIEHGDNILVIGRVLSESEKQHLTAASLGVGVGPGEQIVTINRSLLFHVLEEMKTTTA